MTAKSIIEQVAEERAAESRNKEKRDALLKKKEAWNAQGYLVKRLQSLENGDLTSMEEAYDAFERDVLELGTLRAKIEGINRESLDSDFSGIEANLLNPDKISDIKRDITNLKKKIERRDERIREEAREHELELKGKERQMAEEERQHQLRIQKEARIAAEEARQHELRLKEEAQMMAELKVKKEQEQRMRMESDAKIKEEPKKDSMIVDQDDKKEKAVADAKIFEDDIIHEFIRKMETYPVVIPRPSKNKHDRSKNLSISGWQNETHQIIKKPYKVIKDDFIKVKMSHPEISEEHVPVNKMIYYVVPNKITLGVWVCSRPDRYVENILKNLEEPFSREELSKNLKYLRSIGDAPVRVFTLYSATGWEDSNHSEKPIPSEPYLIYAIKEKRGDDEITSKTNGFDDYSDLFPNIIDLPKKGIPKAKKSKVRVIKDNIPVQQEEKQIGQPNSQLSPDALNQMATQIATLLQTQTAKQSEPGENAPAPAPPQPSQVQIEPILQTLDDWRAYIESIDFTNKKDLSSIAKKIYDIKKLSDTQYWPTFKCIWQVFDEQITKGVINAETIKSIADRWRKTDSDKKYFAQYDMHIDIYTDKGRNPVGLLYYLICGRLGQKLTTDNYTAKWIKDRSKHFDLDE
jgi:hypothetical protein